MGDEENRTDHFASMNENEGNLDDQGGGGENDGTHDETHIQNPQQRNTGAIPRRQLDEHGNPILENEDQNVENIAAGNGDREAAEARKKREKRLYDTQKGNLTRAINRMTQKERRFNPEDYEQARQEIRDAQELMQNLFRNFYPLITDPDEKTVQQADFAKRFRDSEAHIQRIAELLHLRNEPQRDEDPNETIDRLIQEARRFGNNPAANEQAANNQAAGDQAAGGQANNDQAAQDQANENEGPAASSTPRDLSPNGQQGANQPAANQNSNADGFLFGNLDGNHRGRRNNRTPRGAGRRGGNGNRGGAVVIRTPQQARNGETTAQRLQRVADFNPTIPPPNQRGRGAPNRGAGQRLGPGTTYGYVGDYEERGPLRLKEFFFDGTSNGEDWETFMAMFDTVCGGRRMADNQKMVHLLTLLQGTPKEIAKQVAGYEYNTESYLRVWRELNEQYGGNEKAQRQYIFELEVFPRIKKLTSQNILALKALLGKMIWKFGARGRPFDESGMINFKAQQKIPEEDLMRYFERLGDQNKRDSVKEFHSYLEAKWKTLRITELCHDKVKQPERVNAAREGEEDAPEQDEEYEASLQANEGKQTTRQSLENKPPLPKKNEGRIFKCPCCNENHQLWKCEEFKMKNTGARYLFAKNKKLCYHCLGEGHAADKCTFYPTSKCNLEGCKSSHHRLLHNYKRLNMLSYEQYLEDNEDMAQVDESDINDTLANHIQVNYSQPGEFPSIKTCKLRITYGDKTREVIAILDSGSNSTNIDEDLAKQMGIPIKEKGVKRNLNFIQGNADVTSNLVAFQVGKIGAEANWTMNAHTIKDMVKGTPVMDWKFIANKYPHLEGLDIPKHHQRDRVQLLIGTDYNHLIVCEKAVRGEDNEPIAELTRLGWAFAGVVKNCQVKGTSGYTTFMNVTDTREELQTYLDLPPTTEDVMTLNTEESDKQLQTMMEKHWELEAIGLIEKIPRFSNDLKEKAYRSWTKSEKDSDDKLKVVFLDEQKQFKMSIPWKNTRPNFETNKNHIRARQTKQEEQLEKMGGNQKERVKAIFDGYLEKGYIRKLEEHETYERDAFFLPYFCVIDEERDTTPIRIVWDCAAQTQGKSLNSEIELTPNRLQDLFKVLLRMRRYEFVVTSDISEMFLKIILDEKDRRYHRFYFNGQAYEWQVILFGNLSSPNGSQKVLWQNCQLHGKELPEATESVLNSCYMDDVCDSRPTEANAWILVRELVALFKSCGMPIHKFYSNSELVCKNIDQGLLAKQISFADNNDVVYESGKVLGMRYSVEENDCLTFAGKFRNIREWIHKNKKHRKYAPGRWTKRLVTKASASIFDPLGLISPFVARSKVIIQEIWKQKKIDWDDEIPNNIAIHWEDWLNQVFNVPDIKIPRWTKITPKTPYQIHTFCDASEEGICVAVYTRVRTPKGIETTLVAAKSRVTPLKAESISRHELVGCVLGTRLCAAVKETYPAGPDDTFFWTDSEVCLHWINLPAKAFKAFVAHRIGEIQTYTEPRQWLHVPTAENPADIGTRPVTAEELAERSLWWEGPSFLKKPITEWPKSKVVRTIETKELKQTIFLMNAPYKRAKIADELEKLHPKYFSVGKIVNGLNKCLKKWAYVLRFANLFQHGRKKMPKHLEKEEIEAARRFLIKQSQLEFYSPEIGLMSKEGKTLAQNPHAGSEITKFSPMMDEFNVMRSNSRLAKFAHYGFDKTHPIILHRKADITRLIVEDSHINNEHPVGISMMKAQIQNLYAIVGLGTLCKQIQSGCKFCRATKGKVLFQKMAPLPEQRIGNKLKPFDQVGMDFAGPFELKVGRGKPRKKVYVLVLTCMVTRGVHFETTGGMETQDVINAISRFTDMRGVPDTITSDNQTSFRKSDKEITQWYSSIDWDKVRNATGLGFKPNSTGIKWIFNPPIAPHYGGIFETIVKAMKRALRTVMQTADLQEEQFRTVVSKCMHMLNNRPIQMVGDIQDLEPLTPNHFLIGDLANAVFPPDLPEEDQDKLDNRLKHVAMIQEHVWKRFNEEIVPLLGPRTRWSAEKENIEVDEIVIEVDANTHRGSWRMMRVNKVIPSSDGLVRQVEVVNSEGKTYLRPIAKLIPIVRN